MKNKIFIALISAMVISFSAFGRKAPASGGNNSGKGNNGKDPSMAAGCTPATDITQLELNNVRARIETGGKFWQDRANSVASYEIPKGSGRMSIYAGALWMAGEDVNGQLKSATQTFSGNQFWTGPLSTTTAEIDAATCAAWDDFHKITREEVDLFLAWHQCVNDPDCDENTQYPGYSIPESILEYPAHGDVSKDQSYYQAPFYDVNGDGTYDPFSGDYPYYDVTGEVDCRKVRDIRLFGDVTYWWVFNDKGNVHTNPAAPSIGMEIHAQAFAFATNDEVNNMTFYNYELINRSSFTLANTYFSQWVDPDLGLSSDDYVGCDVQRGLGYCFNGVNFDPGGNGVTGYGEQPPAVGVDFFEGPYQDNDGKDNPLTTNVQVAYSEEGIPYGGIGLGYGDGVQDNERFGMRKFVYYNIGGGPQGDPQSALNHYNYMKGIWKDGTNMTYGGDGRNTGIECDYMFPGDSDPLGFGTQGQPQPGWSEATAGNTPGDRRFLQSAGPFTLEPGAVNDITVGVVWARATSGGPEASVENLRLADDKAQALFDNCFKVLNGPDAPEITFQELENELILYVENPPISNNYKEEYSEIDPFIALPDTLDGKVLTDEERDSLKTYRFQGYQIYQVKNKDISVTELDDPDVARLAIQVDKKDGITQLVNFEYSEDLDANIPTEMVNGADEGIRHSFKLTTNLFAEGDNKLINHRTYYYIAIAYGYNNFKEYDPNDPLKLDGQKKPYISSRKAATGEITVKSAIPHAPSPEAGGTNQQSEYGDSPEITRVEGTGNGGNALDLTSATVEKVLEGDNSELTYKAKQGPIQVKVIDPLNVPGGDFTVMLKDSFNISQVTNQSFWTISHSESGKTITSDRAIEVAHEQLLLNWGLSVNIEQVENPGIEPANGNGVIESSISFEDSTKQWLTGIADEEGATDYNWIRSGEVTGADGYDDYIGMDPDQEYEKLVNGTFGPYNLCAHSDLADVNNAPAASNISTKLSKMKELFSVDIVITSDKSKWTRCPVVETQDESTLAEGNAKKLELRESPSVDKEGNPDGTGTGKGWFPGYAINVETGERMNMAFGEDSWLAGENGRDMLWNPTATVTGGTPFNADLRWGGKHYIYVFRNTLGEDGVQAHESIPSYDEGNAFVDLINQNKALHAWKACSWVGIPLLDDDHEFLSTDVKIRIRVEKPYDTYETDSDQNDDRPLYTFNTDDLKTLKNDPMSADSALELINVVPNPYYASSKYETSALDNRVKITNLPEECTVSIYNVSGTLIRQYDKADPKTSLDWDLKNQANIPVAGGVYLIHVNVPDVGEKVLKWFGVMRPVDLETF